MAESESPSVRLEEFLQRTKRIFSCSEDKMGHLEQESHRLKLSSKIADEWVDSVELPRSVIAASGGLKALGLKPGGVDESHTISANGSINESSTFSKTTKELIELILDKRSQKPEASKSLVHVPPGGHVIGVQKQEKPLNELVTKILSKTTSGMSACIESELFSPIKFKEPRKVPRPTWNPPWKLMRVISGHVGWVRTVAVEPGNEWFVTGAGDRMIKIWDLASGTLKLTLTGHVSTVRGLIVSKRHPYLFSCGEDKQIKCWDLECNKVVRHYHGHLSGIYTIDMHPTLDLLVSGGRDLTVRVWDIRTKAQIFALTGHSSTVASVKCQDIDPQIISGSMDSTVRLWDLTAGKTMSVLTNHKKSVRSIVINPMELAFVSAGPDKIKQWRLPNGDFIQNFEGPSSIVNTLALNPNGVLFSGGDDGSLNFWDYKTGYNFQTSETLVQPGSLESEAGIFCSTFDHSGSRLITGEADKSIKVWREDPDATPETHPIKWKPSFFKSRY